MFRPLLISMKLTPLLETWTEPTTMQEAAQQLKRSALELQDLLLDLTLVKLDDVVLTVENDSPTQHAIGITYKSTNLTGKVIIGAHLVKSSKSTWSTPATNQESIRFYVKTPAQEVGRFNSSIGIPKISAGWPALILMTLLKQDLFFTTFAQSVASTFGVQLEPGIDSRRLAKDQAYGVTVTPPFKLDKRMVHSTKNISYLEVYLMNDDTVAASIYTSDGGIIDRDDGLTASTLHELVTKLATSVHFNP